MANPSTSKKLGPLRVKQVVDPRDAIIYGRAAKVFGDRAVAQDWLNTPNPLFEGRKPLDLIEAGELSPVDEILTRIEYGIFS